MSAYGLLIFALVYALAVATPGPGIAAVIARGLGRGTHGAPAFIAGFLVGDLIWFTLAALGLAVLAERAHTLFVGVRFAGAAYLLYLAWRLWQAPAAELDTTQVPRRERPLQTFLGAYTLFAARARVRLTRPQTVRWIQRGTGAVMAGAAVAVATR